MAQPSVDGSEPGKARMAFGSDGSHHYEMAVDSDGHPQVDVVTIPYPGLGDLASDSRTGDLADGSGWTEVTNESGPGVLEGVEFSTNYVSSEVRVTIDGVVLNLPDVAGGAFRHVSPTRLSAIGNQSVWWQAWYISTPNNEFALGLKRAIHYKANLIVEVRQQAGSTKKVSCKTFYRPLA